MVALLLAFFRLLCYALLPCSRQKKGLRECAWAKSLARQAPRDMRIHAWEAQQYAEHCIDGFTSDARLTGCSGSEVGAGKLQMQKLRGRPSLQGFPDSMPCHARSSSLKRGHTTSFQAQKSGQVPPMPVLRGKLKPLPRLKSFTLSFSASFLSFFLLRAYEPS